MATISSNGTGGGNWATGASWNGGASPASGDNAVIVSGDTITKDTAAASNDCVACTVNSGGTLAIGSNGIRCSGAFTNNGTVTGGANGVLIALGDYSGAGHWALTGTAGNLFTLTGGGGTCALSGSRGASTRSAKLNFVALSAFDRLYPQYFSWDDYFRDCTFSIGGSQGIWPNDSWQGCAVVFERCTFNSTSAGSNNFIRGPRFPMYFWGCSIGLTTKFNTMVNPEGSGTIEFLSSPWDANGFFVSDTSEYPQRFISIGGASAAEQGAWTIRQQGATVAKSAAAAKAGAFGVAMTPNSSICSAVLPIWFDLLLPVESGVSITPSLFYKNVTADLDLEAAAGRFWVVCDPGNQWGLYQKTDVNGGADSFNNWRQITFTGGSPSGTAKVGFLRLRVFLARYVATAVVYVADVSDGTTTYDPTRGDVQGGIVVESSSPAGGGLLTNPGMAGGLRG